ncbi:MAG: peroxiredoxin [Methylobacillus sp.]|jgi:peroxiredoxin|nr:peroxiredoxin [Methylobacillus sp.]
MKRLSLILLCCAVALPVFAALSTGAAAPAFTAQASLAGREFTYSLTDALKRGPVVVYFYPGAFTSGCNIQAHTFAENMDQFIAAHASVIGISADKIATLNAFSADPQYCAGKLPVAADADGKIARSYDLKISAGRPGMKNTRGEDLDHDFVERATFIITQDGKIAAVIGGMRPDENVMKSLEIVRKLAGSKAVD